MSQSLRRICVQFEDGRFVHVPMLELCAPDELPMFVSFDAYFRLTSQDVLKEEDAFAVLRHIGGQVVAVGISPGVVYWAKLRARGLWPDVIIQVVKCADPALSWDEQRRLGGAWFARQATQTEEMA